MADARKVTPEGDMAETTGAHEEPNAAGAPRDPADSRQGESGAILCGYALGCRTPAEWMTGTSARCDLHRGLLDADPDRAWVLSRHPELAWRPIARALATMAVPFLLFLLPGCEDAEIDVHAGAPWLAVVGPAALAGLIVLGLVVDMWRMRRSGR